MDPGAREPGRWTLEVTGEAEKRSWGRPRLLFSAFRLIFLGVYHFSIVLCVVSELLFCVFWLALLIEHLFRCSFGCTDFSKGVSGAKFHEEADFDV